MRIVGLLGKNIKYSKSPSMHNEYFRLNNINLCYKLFDLEKEHIDKFIIDAKEKKDEKNSIVGFNVTIPYKEYIINYLDEIKYPANKIKAVNTVVLINKKLIGYNTDYYGFIRSLKERDVEVRNLNALIIGNGGAAKAVFYALKDLGTKNIDIMARSIKNIKMEFDGVNNICNLDKKLNTSKKLIEYDIIINCTPLGGKNFNDICPVEFINLKSGVIAYDLNYTPEKTKFLIEAEKCGAEIINGMDMLINQGIKAREIWLSNIK